MNRAARPRHRDPGRPTPAPRLGTRPGCQNPLCPKHAKHAKHAAGRLALPAFLGFGSTGPYASPSETSVATRCAHLLRKLSSLSADHAAATPCRVAHSSIGTTTAATHTIDGAD